MRPLVSMTEPNTKILSYREALLKAMQGIMESHPEAVIMGQGVEDHKGIFGTTLDFTRKYGANRVLDMPLMEEGMTGIAIGAALRGMYPIQTHIRVDFVLLAMNQLINLAAKYKYMFGGKGELPMLLRLVIGRSWGQGAQHSQSLQSLFAHIPGLMVIMPSTPDSILDSYQYLADSWKSPAISLEHRLMYDLKFESHPPLEKIENPLSSRLLRRGKDLTIVATSIMVLESLRAAKFLSDTHGIECEVIDLHCISHPTHETVLKSVAKTGKLLVADTSWPAYGVSAEVCRFVCESNPAVLKAPVKTLGMAPAPCPTAKSLEDLYYPNLKTLSHAAASLVTGKEKHGLKLPDEKSMSDVYKSFKGPF